MLSNQLEPALEPETVAARPRSLVDLSPVAWSLDACARRDDYQGLLGSAVFRERWLLENHLAQLHADDLVFSLPGICKVCDRPVSFLTDRECGARQVDGVWQPNWRERQICPSCGLNSRHRAAFSVLSQAIANTPRKQPAVYLMEQVTPLYALVARRHPEITLIGSEFLAPDLRSGAMRGNLRHEDAQALSFADESLDIIGSNDVLEHVPEPMRALGECQRVLRAGGQLLLSVPFFGTQLENVTRAALVGGKLEHRLSPQYHGNPLSRDGSLVFTDFGWQLIADLRDAGFEQVSLQVFWSYQHGHLGIPQEFVHATK